MLYSKRVALLNGQIAALAAELGQLRSDQGNSMKLRDEAMMETQRLQLLCTSQRGSLEALTEEMGRQAVKTCVAIKVCMCSLHYCTHTHVHTHTTHAHTHNRYKALEEKLFAEKEDLRSKYETILEEKAKLSKVRPIFVNSLTPPLPPLTPPLPPPLTPPLPP